jgi:hypothetical protein
MSAEAKPEEVAAGVVPVVANVTPSVPPQDLTEQLFKLIVSAVNKSPETGPEAVALIEYLLHSQLQPLQARLREWAAGKLCEDDACFVKQVWSGVKAGVEAVKTGVEAVESSGWCVPKKKK